MNKKNKNSIAKELTLRVSAVLAAVLLVLLVGTYFSLNSEIKRKSEQYTKALVGIFGDLLIYESDNLDHPFDLSFSDRISFFGEYICTWYRTDYIYAVVPDFENNRMTYLASISKVGKEVDQYENLAGKTVDYTFSDEMIRSWNDSTYYAVQKSDRFKNATDVMMTVPDKFGNKIIVGADIAVDEVHNEVMHGFAVFSMFIFIIVVLLATVLYFLIRSKVSTPAKRLSRVMSDYISDGKRSNVKLDYDGDDEYSMIAEAFNHMTDEIDRYLNDISRLSRDQERQRAEFDIAVDIQKSFLPLGRASLSSCGIKAVMKPAKFVGGDLYDYIVLDDKRTMIVVADVSGKGVPSALLMAVILTLIHQFAKMGYSPAGILKNVNDSFSEKNPRLMFVTAFIGIYNSETGLLTYSNAGHNPPYIIHDSLEILGGSDGTPLGLFSGEEYTDVEIKMGEEDTVFLYTDGVNEAVNKSGEFYGTERLEKVLRETASTKEKHFVEAVEASVSAFATGADQNDDITMLSFRARNKSTLELEYDIKDFARIRKLLFDSGLPKEMLMGLCVAAEECFVNICSYAFDGQAPEGERILFQFEYSDNVIMRFSDGGRRFDPRNGLPDTDEYDIDNEIGGLGRLIAFTIADSVDYEYRDGRNILTITKSIKI